MSNNIETMAIGYYGGKWHVIASGTFAKCQTERQKVKQSYKQTKVIHYTNKVNYIL